MPEPTRLRPPRAAAIVPVLIRSGLILSGLILFSLILSGCGLVDKGVFWALTGETPAGAAEKDTTATVKTRAPPDGPTLGSEETGGANRAKGGDRRRAPLLVIPFDQPRADYQQALSDLVGRIQARDPGATFELVTVTPGATDPTRAESASGESRHAAEGVLITLIAVGLSAERVGLSARSDPAIARSEIRLYQR